MNNNSETSEFEFDASQNELLEDLSSKRRFVGLLLLLVGFMNRAARWYDAPEHLWGVAS